MLSGFKGELKAQGVAEAARDPNTNVTAEDAEKVMIEESRKAGATALHFDPNATPAEKAAQARATENPLRQHRPKGVGVVTDLDTNGPDDYDLPPPSAAGVVTAPASGDKTEAANGAPPEKDDWHKVGWEPRFGTGETASIKDEGTLLDHQTFIEANLDEKFFGDWYHNIAIIIFACLTSWVVAILGGGLGWLLIVIAACGSYYRTSIRRTRRNFRDDITRELAKARLDTDHETLEWMNSFLVKFWPIYAPNLAKSIVQSVDQVLSTSTPAFLDSMRMETFILGTKPPRMEHVKTYPKTDDDVVMMDWMFSFTPADTLDMTARQLKYKINPKVVLEIRLGVGMVSKSMKIIVEDFAFSGCMRIKMKLQLDFPHIERVDICFLGRPEIDYVCKPLGGETFGFNIDVIPGLESFIKEQIHANLEPIMYAPHVFPIEVAKLLSGNPMDLAIGVVAVTIHGANGLKNPDKFSGTPDPYTAVSLNSRDVLGKTKTIHENANPRWNETLYIVITNKTDNLTMQVFDYNEFRKDKELGTATFALDRLDQASEHENLQLEVIANGKARGVIQADIRFFPVLGGGKDASGHELPPPESNTGIARLTIEQAKDLDGSKSMVGALNPYGVLLLNGKEVHVTAKLKRTNNPIFPNPSISVLVTDRKKARIGLVLKDDRDIATDPVIGTYQIKLDDMLKCMEKGQEWFFLHGTKTGKAKIMVDWKPVALRGITGGSGGYITPIGVLRVHFKSAQELRNFETLGKSDPYGRVMLSGIMKGRTVTFKNNLNPTWDEVVYVPVHSPSERITVEVMDEEKLGKDRTLGSFEVPLSEYIHENEDGSYNTHDTKEEQIAGLRMNNAGQPKGKLKYTISFFPTEDVIDPEEEAEEKAAEEAAGAGMPAAPATPITDKRSSLLGGTKVSSESLRPSPDARKSLEAVGRIGGTPRKSLDGHSMNGSVVGSINTKKERPKIRITAEDLSKYESGLIVFNIVEGTFAHSNVRLEVLMDDQMFPSYVSSKARQRSHKFGETGDAFVRELDFSTITLRLVEKETKSGNDDGDHVIAKLTGQTLNVLRQCLNQPYELTMKGTDGQNSKVTVRLKYLPVKMRLDASESIANSGSLRVEVLDAAELPAADRNGFSDPYCKFKLNGKEIHKTKIQKKTLHPAWNEFFEVQVPSRTGAQFRCDVYDWDFGDKADYLGGADLNLTVLEPLQPQELTYVLDGKSGVLRLKMIFKPAYVTRSKQGSSTMSGTFAPAGKVVGAPVKGVAKVGGVVGGGVIKGASFLKRGFTGRHSSKDDTPTLAADKTSMETAGTGGVGSPGMGLSRSTQIDGTGPVPAITTTPAAAATGPATPSQRHSRNGSAANTPTPTGTGEVGTASFLIVSASGYPASADVRVIIRMAGAKTQKDLFKTKSIKSSTGTVEYDPNHENFKTGCMADQRFQLLVKDHGTFNSKDLGEGFFYVSDQGSGAEQKITAGDGVVTLRTSFTPSPSSNYAESLRPHTSEGPASPDSRREGRKSFFARRAEGKSDEK